jgi:hypothetical protein
MVRALQSHEVVRFLRRRPETPEEAEKRRLCRMMLGLPPEIVYYHVREGVGTVAVLGLLLILVLAWRLGLFATVAPVLATSTLLAALTPTVLAIRRRYRHVVAGVLVLTAMLAVLAAAVHHYGNPPTVASIVDPTHATIADAVAPR